MEDLKRCTITTLADSVENTLLDYMHQSNLAPGDLLPKEEELASHLNVSRHIIREGISRLKGLDLIESRQHRGMVMKRPHAFISLSKFASARLLSKEDYLNLLEIRTSFELGMCDYIFQRKTPAQLKELYSLCTPEDSCRYSSAEEIAFHSKLFSICDNSMANEFHQTLVTIFTNSQFKNKIRPEFYQKTASHYEICQVLEKGTIEEFHQIMRKHLQPSLTKLSKSSQIN